LARELEYDMRTNPSANPRVPPPSAHKGQQTLTAQTTSTESAAQVSAKKVPKLKAAATPSAYIPSPAKRRISMGVEGGTGPAFAMPLAPASRKSNEVASPSPAVNPSRRLSLLSPALASTPLKLLSGAGSPILIHCRFLQR